MPKIIKIQYFNRFLSEQKIRHSLALFKILKPAASFYFFRFYFFRR